MPPHPDEPSRPLPPPEQKGPEEKDLPEPKPSGVTAGTVEASIGHTPLLRLRLVDTDVPVFAKAEHLNPGGSVKDRAAARMKRLNQ